ncbi:uncharacterized protein LOC111344893 isoform X2 [Stylophora pistillata]|uniref:uncharacterized protein LOC111344893 isoform X2 n=1 Tax=Stylophora pistillata TaxID=50429 RepID=UPI000C042931|nr:uncharacterized protein LOC111344893 isoform X2 [Stylophora pistillata]
MTDQGEVFRDEIRPVLVHFSVNEASAYTLELEGDLDSVYYWQAPSGMTESYFLDFVIEVVVATSLDDVSNHERDRFLDLVNCTAATFLELQKLNQKRKKWYKRGDGETTSILRANLAAFEHIVLYPSQGNITSVHLRINNETDPSGELRRTINRSLWNEATFYVESDAEGEKEESQDICLDDPYSSDEDEEVGREVQASPDNPCYYPSQIEMAAILKKRIDTIMSHYHGISRLREVFNDIEFVVYTARYRMLSDQTEKRICHPDAGVLSKEELESRKRDRDGKKRMFMYVRSIETDTHFDELKRDVQEKPQTMFVIVADECHWGITRDKERKCSAHNRFINEWCKKNPPKNVIVVQISATPFNLLTQNSRLPVVSCVLLRDSDSTTQNEYTAGDLVVQTQDSTLEEHVENTSKELELHVIHWSEVELKNFERGMRMKLMSALNIENSPYQYLQVSTNGKLRVTPDRDDATVFIIQGSHGIVTLKAEPTPSKSLTVTKDAFGNLEARIDPPEPMEFEVKLDFGVGVVAFCSCDGQDDYISVSVSVFEEYSVSLQGAKIERKCGVSILKPLHRVARVSFQFYTDQSGPMEVKTVGKQYLSLNYYLSTLNSPFKKEQKIREDETFQKIVDKAKRGRKMSQSDSTSFPIDALLCADYCYHIILLSVFDSGEKVCEALTHRVEESPATEFQSRLKSFKGNLNATEVKRYIDLEAFELIQKDICHRVKQTFQENLKQVNKLQKQKSPHPVKLQTANEELATSLVECIMHLSPEEVKKLENVDDVGQELQENGCSVMFHDLVQEHETRSLVKDLIQSGKEEQGKMKIVRAKTMKTADQFYYTVQLARKVSCLEECFEVIRDYGGIQIENQLMKSSSPFFKKLQPEVCTYKFDCRCSELKLQPRHKSCANCQHVHKSITQYEDLENLACILILVDKGRMGDTFPQSFDCIDLRLNYDSSQEFKEGSAMYLSSLIQELGRMCRYVKVPTGAIPYALVGRQLFKKLQMSLETSPSISVTPCSKADRYMTRTRKRKEAHSSSLRWLDYEAHKDSYDYENEETHCNRILLQAEPQIGKTGTYLCLIRDLRLDILGKEKVFLTSPAAFDEGTFYRCKESDNPDESVIKEMDEWKDWQFPFWKAIETSPSLYKKPVGTGKYSIGGCFYSHDMEESPFILLKGEKQKLVKTGYQNLKTDDCSNGLRAWHWYHFEKCAECGRLLQGRESVLENVEAGIDGIPVTVTCSLPSDFTSFAQLKEKSKSSKSQRDDHTLPYWIFHPSHRSDPRKCTLNYHHVMQEDGCVANYVQVLVVRREKFEGYRKTWGKVLVILQLPEKLPNCDLGPDEGGIGYARLFIQKIACSLELEYVFMIDDNMAMMSEVEFTNHHMSRKERKVVRDDSGVMQMRRCTFLKPLTSLQKIAQGKDTPPIADGEYESHPLRDDFKAEGFPLYTYTGPAKLFRGKQHESYGILGLMRSIPKAVSPFAKTQVYAAVLLNVKSTTEKGVFYRPWPCWEDLRFNDDCDKEGLWVVKCNGYCFFKIQYKDWIDNLVLPQVFPWDENCTIVEGTLQSELPKDLEEKIILEHLGRFVNTSGPDKCFKGSIGYDKLEQREESPLRIVETLEVDTVTKDDFTLGVSLLVLSYWVEDRRRETLHLLDSYFCRTEQKIVFVASAMEAKKRWPQLTIHTISTENGICHNAEMSDRNAQFALFSAADPRRHRLRRILIEASFSQGNEDLEGKASRSNEIAFPNNLVDTRDVSAIKEGISSNMENRNYINKRGKRSLQEPLASCSEIKRQKTEDDWFHQLDNVYSDILSNDDKDNNDEDDLMCNEVDDDDDDGDDDDDDDEVICLGSSSNQQTPQFDRGFFQHSADFRESSSIRSSLDSAHNDQESAQDEIYPSDLDEIVGDGVQNDSDTIILNETRPSQDKAQEEENDYPKYIEGTSGVTKAIVDLWIKYKKISGSSHNVMEDIENTLDSFTPNQLQERDEKGYTPLLKACSLPSMSPLVMKYLISTKIDITCQLPPNFGGHHPSGEGLVPGMSALSVAIKCKNVSLVKIFKKEEKKKLIKIRDEEENSALHHSILSCSKSAFKALVPLYEAKDARKMLNRDGKSPLDIALEMESTGMFKGKQEDNIRFMIKELKKKKKKKNNSIQKIEKYLSPIQRKTSTPYQSR